MSDHVMQSDHDSDRVGRPSMHLYQSVWMAHWTQTSCKPETRGDNPLSVHYGYKENDTEIKQHGPEIQQDVSKYTKGFGEDSESRTVNVMNENLKLSSIKSGNERLESRFFPKFSLSQNRESIMAVKNVTTCQGIASEMGTSSRHFQPKGVLGDLQQQVKSHESPVKKRVALSTSFLHDAGSSSKIVPYRYNSSNYPIHSFQCTQEEINQSIPVVASEEHFTNSKFLNYSTSLAHDKKAKNLLDLRRSATSSSRQNNMPLLLHDPSASNEQPLSFVGKQCEKIQNHSGARLFPTWSNPLDATKSETSFHDFFSAPRIPRSLHDVNTMRICTTGGHPKFSQTTHHFLITKKTDVNLSEGGEMVRDSTFSTNIEENMLSKFLSSSPGFGLHGQQGVKLQPLGSTTDSEEKEKFGDVKTSAVCLKNESSAETDTMDIDVFQKDHFSVVVSSPTTKVIEGDQASTSQAAIREEIEGRLPNIELPDINQELPALPAVASSVDNRETSPSRTQSLDAEHLLSHAELPTNSKSDTFVDGHVGSEPSSRWVKRLKLSAPGSFAHGIKSSEIEEGSSHEKVNKFVNKIMRGNLSSSPAMGKSSGKEPMTLDQTAGLLRNGESSSSKLARKIQDVTLSNPWIQRWCHHGAASPMQNREAMTLCQPRSSNATLDEFRKKQFPSLAAMALMGKALNSFQPCEFRKTGSYIIWKS